MVGGLGKLKKMRNEEIKIVNCKIVKKIMVEINNKYQNGQKIYFLNGKKKCQCEEVTCVNVFMHADGTVNITYSTASECSINENEVFATEAEVKDYVFRDLIEFV